MGQSREELKKELAEHLKREGIEPKNIDSLVDDVLWLREQGLVK